MYKVQKDSEEFCHCLDAQTNEKLEALSPSYPRHIHLMSLKSDRQSKTHYVTVYLLIVEGHMDS